MEDRKNHQKNRKELTGGQPRNEHPTIVPAEEFDDETGDPIAKAIRFHPVVLLREEKQEEIKQNQEPGFHELDREDGNPAIVTDGSCAVGTIDDAKAFHRPTIAATAEEAADPTKSMADGDAREDKIHQSQSLLADRIDQNEEEIEKRDAKDDSAQKGNPARCAVAA